jgi:holo-ACP synthase
MTVLSFDEVSALSGPEALYCVQRAPLALKQALIGLETTHPLGRLWDIDVICPENGSITRRALGLAPRRCLICDEAAHVCARSRRHSLEELRRVIEEKVEAYRAEDRRRGESD